MGSFQRENSLESVRMQWLVAGDNRSLAHRIEPTKTAELAVEESYMPQDT